LVFTAQAGNCHSAVYNTQKIPLHKGSCKINLSTAVDQATGLQEVPEKKQTLAPT